MFHKLTSAILVSIIVMVSSVTAYNNNELISANNLAHREVIRDNSENPTAYNLNDNVLRQEIALISRRVSGIEENTSCKNIFTDVSTTTPNTWACNNIEALVDNNFISRNESFRPEDFISKSEALIMLIRSIGFNFEIDNDNGINWQTQVVEYAYNKWVVDNFTDYNELATRGWVFKIAEFSIVVREEEIKKEKLADNITYQLFSGEIDLVNNRAEFSPVIDIESNSLPIVFIGVTNYTLEVLDNSNQILTSVPIKVNELIVNQISTGEALFSIKLEKQYDMKKIVLKNKGNIIWEIIASNNSPIVNVTYPNGGEKLLKGNFTVTWTTSDIDGDILYSTVQYSSDNGISWNTFALDTTDTSISINTVDIIASNTALIRVMTSDGLNVTTDTSDAVFQTPNNRPEVDILSPKTNSTYGSVQLVIFRADVGDAEDGALSNNDIIWTSNIDGVLGIGNNINILASDLTEGTHIITLTATDSAGHSSHASISLKIVRIFESVQ